MNQSVAVYIFYNIKNIMSSSDSDMNVVGAQSQCTQSEWSRAPWKKSKGDNDEDGDDLFAPNVRF